LDTYALREKGFDLTYITAPHDQTTERWDTLLAEHAGEQGVILQERILLPKHKADPDILGKFTPGQLVLVSHPELPVQRSAIVLRPSRASATISRLESGVKFSDAMINILYGFPVYSDPQPDTQTFYSSFTKISQILSQAGMTESDLTRTWLYAASILSSYEELNDARDMYFKEWFSSSNTFVPASTGIQGITPHKAALSIDFCAFSGQNVRIEQLRSPLQNEPTEYRKFFSRAVKISFPQNRLIMISGTASINKEGHSVHIDDFGRQLLTTLDVLEALLQQEGAVLADTAQAIVYLKRHSDLDACINILAARGFPTRRMLLLTDTDVCRPELLCEIELVAVRPSV
jgi:enamine deaminase RidA (YjgF/YER057c/UK114 family)